jgi:GxxExxY protein
VSIFYFRKESDLISRCAQKVQRLLGNCLTKEIYMDALEFEFARAGLISRREVPLPVYYGEEGEEPVRLSHVYTADFVVEEKILVAVRAEGNTGQMEDYALLSLLQAAQMHLAVLVQFKDKKVQINRVCRYSRYVNNRNLGLEGEGLYAGKAEWGGKEMVLTGAGASD